MLGIIIIAASPCADNGACGVVDIADVVVEPRNCNAEDSPIRCRHNGSKGGEDIESVLLTACC